MPATATTTRGAVPPPPPPAPPPERAHLAAAVEKHRAATERLVQLKAARSKALDARMRAFTAVETAEALLAATREDQPHEYVARLLDGPGADGSLIEAATSRLTEARRQHDVALAGREALEAEIKQAEFALTRTRVDRDAALRAFVSASPAATALVAEYDAALAHLESVRLAMAELGHRGCLPPSGETYWADNRLGYHAIPVDPRPAIEWRDALAALETDPAAPLPGAAPVTNFARSAARGGTSR